MNNQLEPYVKRDPGDVIRSGDWNQLQVEARKEVREHRHTGGDQGIKIPREGIEANAIDGSLIDPAASVVLDSLSVNRELKISGNAILGDIGDLHDSLTNKVNRAGDTISGSLTIDGNIGIGMSSPEAKLHIEGGTDATLSDGGYLTLGNISGVNLTLDKSEIMARNNGTKAPLYLQNLGGDLVVQTDKFVVKDNGNVGVGTTEPKAKLEVTGKIKAENHFKLLSHNIINNSFMNRLQGNMPKGYEPILYSSGNSSIDLEAVSPFTKGFEGPYLENKPANAVSNPEDATGTNPYWYGRWYKGPRAAQGGLADGWGGHQDGHILKITGSRQIVDPIYGYGYGGAFLSFATEHRILTRALLFTAWVKINTGALCYGSDVGVTPHITRSMTEEAPQGWYRINEIVGTSHMTTLDGPYYFLFKPMGEDENNNGDFEMYLALPYLANIEQDDDPHWSPSILDVLHDHGVIGDDVI